MVAVRSEVEQRAVDSAFVAREMIWKKADVRLRRRIGCAPVSRPIDPRRLFTDERKFAVVETEVRDGVLRATRETDDGYETWELSAPAVLSLAYGRDGVSENSAGLSSARIVMR